MALGRFRLLERIGAGGFGTVYRGLDERLERAVAVKVIEARGRAVSRVAREAQAAARLNHPGIVTLYELGEAGGRAFLVSELVEGNTLDRLCAAGALSDRDVAELGAELCDALEHAHAHGVIHRDIKPQNVIVRPHGVPPGAARAKLMDFGTALLVDGPALTATGEVIGTLAYMAPEQAEGADTGPATDVYSVALTLYECLTGENPFARATPAASARAIGRRAPPLAERRPELPLGLRELLDACLQAEPELRPAVRELRRGLAAVAPHLSDQEHPPVPSRNDPILRSPSPRALAWTRIAVLAAVTTAAAFLGLVAQLPGAAVVVAVLLLPAPLLLPTPQWGLPAVAPVLGAAGIAPVFPALASLAATPGRRAATAVLGWAWLVAAEAILGSRLLFATASEAPAGWTGSLGQAATGVLLPVLAPHSILVALVWAGGAVVLGALIRGRMIALELLAALVWSAGLVAVHGALGGDVHETPAGPLAAALVAAAVAIMWARSGRHPTPQPGMGHTSTLP